MKALIALLSMAFIIQFGCQSKGESKVELSREQAEAQRLVDGGISFSITKSAQGQPFTTGCGLTNGKDYLSSDGVKVLAPNTYCTEIDEAVRCFDSSLKDAQEVFENIPILDDNQRPFGKRLVGVRGDKEYFITYLRGKGCSTYSSPSLRHLLAFEKLEDQKREKQGR